MENFIVSRLYYWIKGAPEDRPGGPWWYMDFDYCPYKGSAISQRYDFFKAIKPFLQDYKFYDGQYIVHNNMDIYPPKETVEGGAVSS